MITTFTPNPAIDSTYLLERVTLGEVHRVAPPLRRVGGKGVNAASILKEMGYAATAVAPVGASDLDGVRTDLADRGIDARLIGSPSATRRSIAIVEQGLGRASVFNESGDAQPPEVWRAVSAAIEELARDSATLAICGSWPPDTPSTVIGNLIDSANSGRQATIVDCGGTALRTSLRHAPLLVKPNLQEALEAFEAQASAEGNARTMASRLTHEGARAAIVSDGEAGLFLHHGDVALRAWLPTPVVGNATGAGDALTAALAADIDRRGGLPGSAEEWSMALRRAVGWAAASVRQPAAGQIRAADVDQLEQLAEVE